MKPVLFVLTVGSVAWWAAHSERFWMWLLGDYIEAAARIHMEALDALIKEAE